MRYSIVLVVFSMFFFSCSKKDKQSQQEIDEVIIKSYIAQHNLDASPTGTGLYYVVEKQGAGLKPTSSSTVTVAYKGYLTDGNVFDESSADGITFSLSNVILGWQEGIPLFNEGGKGTLLIPSGLGYGSQGSGEIPKNAVLIFEVELIKVF